MPGATSPDDLAYPLVGEVASPRIQVTALADTVQSALSKRQINTYRFASTAEQDATVADFGDTAYNSETFAQMQFVSPGVWRPVNGIPVTAPITYSGIYSAWPAMPARVTSWNGRVQIEGVVTSTSASFGFGTLYVIGSIPVSMAPRMNSWYACVTNGTAFSWVEISTAGVINFICNTTFTGSLQLSMSNCTWLDKALG